MTVHCREAADALLLSMAWPNDLCRVPPCCAVLSPSGTGFPQYQADMVDIIFKHLQSSGAVGRGRKR